MLELTTVQISKFVRNIYEKRKEMHYSKKSFIKPFGQSDVAKSSVNYVCIGLVTIRRIPKKECVCQKLQRRLRQLWVNYGQDAHEGASFVDI